MSGNPNLITVTRQTGYRSQPCEVCRTWGETTDARDNESFALAVVCEPHGMALDFDVRRVTVCHTCLRVLEEACYVAHRERAMAGEVA